MKSKILIIALSIGILTLSGLISCKKVTELAETSTTISKITKSTVICIGTISDNGGASITEKGFCWSIMPNPTMTDNKIIVKSDSSRYTDTIAGLKSNITYYLRSYAINSKGLSYGNEESFTLWINTPGPVVSDIDGNSYSSVKIGSQLWMVENLRVTKYRNGDLIGTTNPDTLNIQSENTPKYQWIIKGNDSKVAIYGRLYTWYAINDSRNIAPAGWHVPTDSEWLKLIDFLGGQNYAGGKLMEVGTTYWKSSNIGFTNESGFSAISCSYRAENGHFYNNNGTNAYWWSSSVGHRNDIGISWILFNTTLIGDEGDNASIGFSVRCIMD